MDSTIGFLDYEKNVQDRGFKTKMTNETSRDIAYKLIPKNIQTDLREELVDLFEETLNSYGQKQFEEGVRKAAETLEDVVDLKMDEYVDIKNRILSLLKGRKR